MTKNLKQHMMNLASNFLKNFILIGVLLNICSCGKSQTIKTGVYHVGSFAVDGEDITGIIEDGIGDESFGSPVRSCFIYLTGKLENGEPHIVAWDVSPGEETKKYSVVIQPDKKRSNRVILIADNLPEAGICKTSTFEATPDKKYSLAMIFTKEMPWKSIRLVKSSIAKLYKQADPKSAVLKTISGDGAEVVYVLEKKGEWCKIILEDMGNVAAWINEKDLYSLK